MKELTIEEKAARYDEAIDIARKINSGEGVAAPSGWTTCEVIFPELKESKDKKIRESLLEYLHTLPNHYAHSGVCAPEWIAWLEEQSKTFTKKDVDYAYLKGVYDAKQELEKQGEQKPIDVRTTGYWYVEDMEQKPAEWSGEDEDYINDLIKYFSQNERLKNTKEDIVIWLKSLRLYKQWKPSDGQMDSITCAVRKMKESACYDSELMSLYQDLKKLKEE